MSGIRSAHTKPEIALRKELHRRGFRFRLHCKNLRGTPDIVLPRYNAVIFLHGCFWHLHDCHLFKWPSTRAEFWKQKIERNVANDQRAISALEASGWRTAIVWECSMKGKLKDLNRVFCSVDSWLRGEQRTLEIQG